jgi:arylsulfatase A-like enzyme
MTKGEVMNRREFLRGVGVGAASFVFAGSGGVSVFGEDNTSKKPNIVFILVDDLGWHQLGCCGSDFYETPNIDALARQGMRFTDAYAACPVCSPTRASIMTGKYPARLHITNHLKGSDPKDEKLLAPKWADMLGLEEVTIAEALRERGYVNGHFGKWHLSIDKNYRPHRPGDPHSQGFDDVLTTHKPGKGPKSPYENDAHHVRQITEHSLKFIEANRDKPFFCYISHNSIHRPEVEREELVAKYRAKPGADSDQEYGHNNPVQAAMLETLDKSVAMVLNKLDELNLADNTLLVFFGDNGHLGPKDSKPLRGSKADLYEGGIREPLIVRWRGVVEAGSVCEEPVISNDFFPTLVEAAGGKVTDPTVDGVSIMPLLKQNGKLKRDALYWHYPHYHHQGIAPSGAIREGNYKLIEWYEKSIHGIDTLGALELYDLSKDLNEQNNLADKMPKKTKQLYKRLNAWRKKVRAQDMSLNPDYKPKDDNK